MSLNKETKPKDNDPEQNEINKETKPKDNDPEQNEMKMT